MWKYFRVILLVMDVKQHFVANIVWFALLKKFIKLKTLIIQFLVD